MTISDPGDGELVRRLNETITRAYEVSPYYAKTFQNLDLKLQSLRDLRRFPVLRREELIRHSEQLLARGSIPATVGFTGGTTYGGGSGSLLFWKNLEEVKVKEATFRALRWCEGSIPLLLHIVNLGHGLDPGGAREGCFQVPLERLYHFDVLTRLLRTSFPFPNFTPRITAMAGPLRLLKALTILCMERGIPGEEFEIQLISSSSNYLTPRWKALLENYWQAQVDDVYGVSEVPGLYTSRCEVCGYLHFSPSVMVEVVDIQSGVALEKGMGRLLATSLYPLASMQPIIRYDTEDILEVMPVCAKTKTYGYEFRGRICDVLRFPTQDGNEVVIAPTMLQRALDAMPEISCRQFEFCRPLGIDAELGPQKWQASAEGKVVTLAMELRWSPLQFPMHVQRVKQEAVERVLAEIPALKNRVATGELEIDVKLFGPGKTGFCASV